MQRYESHGGRDAEVATSVLSRWCWRRLSTAIRYLDVGVPLLCRGRVRNIWYASVTLIIHHHFITSARPCAHASSVPRAEPPKNPPCEHLYAQFYGSRSLESTEFDMPSVSCEDTEVKRDTEVGQQYLSRNQVLKYQRTSQVYCPYLTAGR